MTRFLLLAALGRLAAGCADPEPTCGDGLCDSSVGETNATCSSDCQVDPFSCGPCPALMACPPMRGGCLPAFIAGDLNVGIVDATLSAARPDTTPWDDNDAADPYVVVTIRGELLGTTTVAAETAAPSWNEPVGPVITLAGQDDIRFDIFDEDGATDELMFSCTRMFDGPLLSYAMPDQATLQGICRVMGQSIAFTLQLP